MGVSLIVVHYRTREPLTRLLESLRAANPRPLREIVIVNNSGEPLGDLTRGAGWPVRVLDPKRNVGYARGVNAGIRASSEEDLLILNPDVTVEPGSVETLERAARERPRAGILAPRLLNPDGTLQLSARRFYNWRTLLLRRAPLFGLDRKSRDVREHLMLDWDHRDTRPVDWVIGAALYVRRGAVRDVGLMDERYFLYFEDVDWCQRMWRHGYEVVYCADATMRHEHARSSAQLDPRSVRAHAAGLLRFAEKWSAVLYVVSGARRRIRQILTLLLDVLAAVVACAAAYGIRALLDPWFDRPVHPIGSYSGLLFFTVGVTVAALLWNGLYRRVTFTDRIERVFLLGQAVIQAGLLLMAATFLFQMPRYSRVLVLLVGPLLFAFLYVSRGLLARLEAGARAQGFAFRRVLLLGSGGEVDRARAALEASREEGYEPLHARVPSSPEETPEAASARIRALIESERVQIVCAVPEPDEVPYLLALASSLRDTGAAVWWAGSVAHLASASGEPRRLGPLEANLLHAPSRGFSLRARKRMSDLLLSFLIAPWRWGRLRAYLASRGESIGPGEAWRQVLAGERSWVGRSRYEADLWTGVPDWARLALEPLRPGVVSPGNGRGADRSGRLESELAYLSRFSLAEDLRIFLRATEGAR
ncbi:MAG TPA: glycosyltransferase family 2 protein [Candidatus Eisenbacteria bacterium]|nr:glycosyltransferase family 2 protein [Candidatus Eisenbacteria bacterium]